jgi:hypothetical protein
MMFDYYENLPTTFKKLALANQKLQGNRIDSYKRLGTTKSKGGFNVKESVEGPLFWADVKQGHYKSLYVRHKLRDLSFKKVMQTEEKILEKQIQDEALLEDVMNEINNL